MVQTPPARGRTILDMRLLGLAVTTAITLCAAPGALFNSTGDAAWKNWSAVHGSSQSDSAVRREGRASLRVESVNSSDAIIRSAPVSLRPGKSYELSGWVRTEALRVHDTDRTPIAVGASLAMGSMPFDVHSESVAGTSEWQRVRLRFTATRSSDNILLRVAEGGNFTGRAWFDSISLDEVATAGSVPAKESVKTFGPAYRYPSAGWIYLHIEGKPYERGYQHGFLMPTEIERYLERCAAQLDSKSRERAWENGRITADALFTRGFDDEIREEMKGIADGAAAAGAKWHGRKVDLIDIVTANTIVELGELRSALHVTRTGLEGLGFKSPEYFDQHRDVPANDRCSSFAATGKATRDGHMIVAHTTWWPLTLAEQTNVMLDIQPATGHRMLMQSYPGGIESGTDWYQNDAGVVLTETTIRQSPFNRDGTPVAYRARKAIQYADNIDKVVEILNTRNNGLYTNEWIIGDAKNDEIAMFELGTYKTKLWRSSKNEWFGGTEGFYWGNNNAKDLQVRLEELPDPKGNPEHVPYSPAPRDIKWREMYRQFKGAIDEQFAFLAFRTAPLMSNSAMDAKIATGEMASNLMMWAAIGKPNQRERLAAPWDNNGINDGLYPAGYKLFAAKPVRELQQMITENEKARIAPAAAKPTLGPDKKLTIARDRLWRGWILPASDGDIWLSAGSANYHGVLAGDHPERGIARLHAQARGDAAQGDVPLAQLHQDFDSSLYMRIASHKGALLLDALRVRLGDDRFLTLMQTFFDANTTKTVTTAVFQQAASKAAGEPLDSFFSEWLTRTGIPGDKGGPSYVVTDLFNRLGSAIIVYGTMAEAGSNRYAAEQLQKLAMDWHERAIPIRKDFAVTDDDLRTHDVIFIGRPESNQALARHAAAIGLQYEGNAFTLDGKVHASEYESLVQAAANPLDPKRLIVIVAGNAPLETVKAQPALMGVEQSSAVLFNGKPGAK